MPARTAEARWEGTLREGNGTMRFGSGAFDGRYSFASRFEEGTGTNPEELVGAAHAGCFSMALSKVLADAGSPPNSIETRASVHLENTGGGFSISRIDLVTRGDVPGMSGEDFQKHAEAAKQNCPVSKALAGVDISVDASLAG